MAVLQISASVINSSDYSQLNPSNSTSGKREITIAKINGNKYYERLVMYILGKR